MDEEYERTPLERFELALAQTYEKAARTRKDFAQWLHSSVWGLAFDLVNCALSLVSVTLYIVQTYFSEWHGPVSEANATLMKHLDLVCTR
jgi:hypothetical protein